MKPAGLVLIDGALLSAFVVSMLVIGGATIHSTTIPWLLFGSVVIVTAGHVIVFWTFGEDTPARHTLATLLGSLAMSIGVLAGCLTTNHNAGVVFLYLSPAVAAAGVWTFRCSRAGRHVDQWERVAIGLLGLLVAYWCHRPATLWPVLQATGMSTAWSDYSIHGASIAEFGSPQVGSVSSFLLAGQPLVFYHYASFMLPAVAARVVDLPPWGLAASLLLPYGIFLMTLGTYVLTRLMATSGLALLAPLLLLLIPDASTVGLKNGFFGFHWLLMTAPGSGYGIAAAFATIAALVVWRRDRRSACLWLAGMLALSIFQFRAQIFVLLVGTLVLTFAFEAARTRRDARRILLGSSAAVLFVLVTLLTVPRVRAEWLNRSGVRLFLSAVHNDMAPTAYDGLYQSLQRRRGTVVAAAVGVVLLVPAALGVLTIALPIGLVGAVRRRGWQSLDLLPVWCVVAWLGIVLLAPASARSGPTEYPHRPFVLVYAVAFLWTLLFARRAMPDLVITPSQRRVGLFLTAVGIAVFGHATGASDRARPRFAWGPRAFEKSTNRGVIDAAMFLRVHAGVGDTFALTPTEPDISLDDKATEVAALSGVPAYLARVGIQMVNGTDRGAITTARLAELTRVETTTDADVAFQTLQRASIDFLVVIGDHGPRFDPAGSRAVYRAPHALVYRVTSSPPSR